MIAAPVSLTITVYKEKLDLGKIRIGRSKLDKRWGRERGIIKKVEKRQKRRISQRECLQCPRVCDQNQPAAVIFSTLWI